MRVTQPIRDEHAQLLPELARIRALADELDELDPVVVTKELYEVVAFLRDELIPHAVAEDAVLYPAVARLLGAPDATATMGRDHTEGVRYVDELHDLLPVCDQLHDRPAIARTARRLLYGLDAVLRLHFAKEEELYLPLLDAGLDEVDADELYLRLAHAHDGTHPDH